MSTLRSQEIGASTVEPFVGKFVAVVLNLRGQTTSSLFGKVLSAGSGGFVIDGESFTWPTSVKYPQLVDIRPDARHTP